jgi:hypothetical protein
MSIGILFAAVTPGCRSVPGFEPYNHSSVKGGGRMSPKVERFNKLAIGTIIGLSMVLFTGCLGYVGDGGEPLLEYMDPANLYQLTQNPEPDIFIIDVRAEAFYNSGHIPTALNFPVAEIASRIGEPPLDDPDNYFVLY